MRRLDAILKDTIDADRHFGLRQDIRAERRSRLRANKPARQDGVDVSSAFERTSVSAVTSSTLDEGFPANVSSLFALPPANVVLVTTSWPRDVPSISARVGFQSLV